MQEMVHLSTCYWKYRQIILAEMILKKLLFREKVNVPQWVLKLLQGGK